MQIWVCIIQEKKLKDASIIYQKYAFQSFQRMRTMDPCHVISNSRKTESSHQMDRQAIWPISLVKWVYLFDNHSKSAFKKTCMHQLFRLWAFLQQLSTLRNESPYLKRSEDATSAFDLNLHNNYMHVYRTAFKLQNFSVLRWSH